MKYLLLTIMLLLSGCGTFIIKPDRVVYKYKKISCLGLRCCFPYDEKEMIFICNEGNSNGDNVFIRYRFGK